MRPSEQWRRTVRARVRESERILPGKGALGASFWDGRARRFASRMEGSESTDPMLARVLAEISRSTTVIDAGAGPGRFTIPLARRARHVTAVDPSPGMLRILRQRVRKAALANVAVVEAPWQEAEVEPADVVVCSYVLTFIEDAAGFLEKLDESARRRVYVYMSPGGIDVAMDPVWRHFHGRPRAPSPTYLDAQRVCEEIGIKARAELVEVPVRTRFRSVADALPDFLDHMLLEPTAANRKEMRRILEGWLVRDAGGLRQPFKTMPAAILSWEPARRRGGRRAPR